MANITVTLLTSKRTRQTIDSYDTAVAAQRGGYVVVEGENESTEITVNYPEAYASQTCYVYMKNARGEYLTKTFEGLSQSKKFTLPAEMTYRGNTFLVFVAQRGDVVTKWLPVVVPIAATGIDYHKVAVASEDFLKEVLKATDEAVKICQELQQQAKNGEFDGKSVFVRYSASPDGAGMTEKWVAGQRYMGISVGHAAPAEPSGYNWALFVGDAECTELSDSGAVTVTLNNYTDITLTSPNLTTVTVNIPENTSHGYYAGLNIRTGATPPKLIYINRNQKPLKLIVNGTQVDDYIPGVNVDAQMAFFCDGLTITAYIAEVSFGIS